MAKKSNKSVAKPQDSVTDEQHNTLVTWVNEFDDATLESRNLSEKSRDYYDSKQLSDAEVKELKARGQPIVVINRIKPKMDGLMGMEKSNKTTVKCFARTPKHQKGAQAATESIKFVLQDNFYDQIRSQGWNDLLMEGTCGTEISVKNVRGEKKITQSSIHWDRLIYDPHRRQRDYSDAKFLGQFIWMDHQDSLDMFPDAKEILETTFSGSDTFQDKPKWVDQTRKRVRVIELYWKDGGEVKFATFTRGGYCSHPKTSIYKNEDGETVWPYEFSSMFIDREGQAYGACRQLLDVQDEINKRRSKALHLMSVRQTFGTAGAVADVNEARKQLAKPDGHVEFAFGEMGKDFGILPTGDMVAAQFNLLTESKNEIDAVSYNAAAAGKETRQMSGVALRSREAASQTELAPMFDVLKNHDLRVYRKVWNTIKQFWKEEKWIRVTDDENNLKWVGLNKPMTKGEMMLQQAQEQGMPPEQLQQMQAQIAQDPMMQEIVSTENDIVNLDVDMIIEDAPDSVTTQIEDFQVIGEMVKSGFQMPPLAVIEASPLSNKDKIIKMMKEAPQLSPEHQKQMEEMQQQMETLQQEGQKLQQENQQLKMGAQESQMKIQAGAQESQMKAQAKREEAMANIQLEKEVQEAKLQLEREAAMAKIQLEREKAVAQLELEKMKAELNADGEVDQAISKVQNLISMHETKVQSMFDMHSAKQEGDAETQKSEMDTGNMQAMHQEMINAVGEIVNNMNQKKSINLIRKDGMISGAEVTTLQ